MKTIVKLSCLTVMGTCLVLLAGCSNVAAIVNLNGEDDGFNWNDVDIPVPGGIAIPGDYAGRMLTVNPAVTFQKIDGFAAAGGQTGAFVGRYWNEPVKQQIADFLFSQAMDEKGQPRGAGLSMWRVNLGGGSFEQGRNSKIVAENRADHLPQLEDGAALHRLHAHRGESYLADVTNPFNATVNPLFAVNSPLSLATETDIGTGVTGIVYDWAKNEGYQYWMREAKKRGLETLVAASFSPIVSWTRSGTGNNIQPGSSLIPGSRDYPLLDMHGNLTEEGYTHFPDYLADVADYFANPLRNVTGPDGLSRSLRFDYISPVNEPQFPWNHDSQEGSAWSNANIARISTNLDAAIKNPLRTHINADNTKILIPETASWVETYSTAGGLASDQINAFFNPAQNTYVGNLDSMAPVVAGHTYWTHETDVSMVMHRQAVRDRTREFNVEAWNTEWCGLGFGEDYPWGQHNLAPYWYVAHFMAKLIHADLAVAELTSWSFWTGIDTEMTIKNHYSLVGVSNGTEIYDPLAYDMPGHFMTDSGSAKAQSTLWTLGNYSLFVRPGFERIDVTPNNFPDGTSNPTGADTNSLNNLKGLMVTAYKSPPGFVDAFGDPQDRIVLVYVNWLESNRPMAVEFADGRKPTLIRCYVTTEDNTNNHPDGRDEGKQGMRRMAHEDGVYTIPPRSVLTVVYDF